MTALKDISPAIFNLQNIQNAYNELNIHLKNQVSKKV